MLEKKVKVDIMNSQLELLNKYELGKRYERDYNLKIKIYDNILMKLFHGNLNAFVFLQLSKKDIKKIKIYFSKKLFIDLPLPLFEFVLLHEIGHTKTNIQNSEDCANSFVLNKLGLDEYIKRKSQIDTYFKYRTFDISQLKKLQNISHINFIKLRLHLISLEDINAIKCPKCGKIKPSTEYYKYESAGNKLTYWCKECIEYYIKNTSVGAN